MKASEIVEISIRTLDRLCEMGVESSSSSSCGKMVFPIKANSVIRISEQELRFVFVEEFIKRSRIGYFYSVETPTKKKYSFGKSFYDIKAGIGQSALADMMIYKQEEGIYQRNLNIEFKHANVELSHIAKDILKLVNESQNGAFIHLLDNTDSGTLCNEGSTGVLDKLRISFDRFDNLENLKYKPLCLKYRPNNIKDKLKDLKFLPLWQWNYNNNEKCILIVVMSLKQKALIYRTISKSDLNCLDKVFLRGEYGNIETVISKGVWKISKCLS